MKAKVLFKYICQYYHECYMTGFDDWVSEKVVDTESEAEAWVDEAPEHEDRRYFRIKFFSDSDVIKEQFESMKNNIKSDFPKDVVISAFESTLKTIEEEWNMPLYSKGEVTNLPEKHKNLLLIVKTDGGNFVYKTAIFNDWTKDLFQKNRVIAWKYIETPDWFNAEEFSIPAHIVFDLKQPICPLP